VVCSGDTVSRFGFTVSCKKFVAHIGDAFMESGEVAQRRVEGGGGIRLAGGPTALANVITFEAKNEPQVVWSAGDVKVSVIRSTHIPGHGSYRVDTPAGSVVIGGDATNDLLAPPRPHSTSDQVELLAKGVDVIVHSSMHPAMGPDKDSGMPPEVFYRQTSTTDLGAMAKRVNAKHLMLTHMGPSIGAARQGPYKVPGGPLTAGDFRKAVEASGYAGNVIVGSDLASLRLPAK
jgi:ribonuclease Z